MATDRDALRAAIDALEEIALAGMSRRWHGCTARRARKAHPVTDAQPLGYIPADAVEQLAPPRLILRSVPIYTYEGVRTVPIYLASSQQDRAVMQQALDALQTLHSTQAEWHAAFPEHVGDKEAPAMQAASSAIAALSASIGKVSEPRDG